MWHKWILKIESVETKLVNDGTACSRQYAIQEFYSHLRSKKCLSTTRHVGLNKKCVNFVDNKRKLGHCSTYELLTALFGHTCIIHVQPRRDNSVYTCKIFFLLVRHRCTLFTNFQLMILQITHWGRHKIDAILQTTFLNTFLGWKCIDLDPGI